MNIISHKLQRETKEGISVVIPVYNRSNELYYALSSVYSQTRLPDEVIIVDDSSDDDPSSVASCFPVLKIRIVRLEQKSNASVARNHGVTLARFKLIAFLDSDDVWSIKHLEKMEYILYQFQADIVLGRAITKKRLITKKDI